MVVAGRPRLPVPPACAFVRVARPVTALGSGHGCHRPGKARDDDRRALPGSSRAGSRSTAHDPHRRPAGAALLCSGGSLLAADLVGLVVAFAVATAVRTGTVAARGARRLPRPRSALGGRRQAVRPLRRGRAAHRPLHGRRDRGGRAARHGGVLDALRRRVPRRASSRPSPGTSSSSGSSRSARSWPAGAPRGRSCAGGPASGSGR